MLYQFLADNRAELIARCRFKVAQRPEPEPGARLEHGIPLFLDQLIAALRLDRAPDSAQSRKLSSELGMTAAQHGLELFQHGFTVDQVVHDYGDLCQAITELAFERSAPVGIEEFRTLNRCLDNAIADAVSEFSGRRDVLLEQKSASTLSERPGSLAHELRSQVHTVMLAVTALKVGPIGLGGATGAVLDRSLIALRTLIDRSLLEVRGSKGTRSRAAPSRRTTGICACARFRARDASSPSTCRAARCPKVVSASVPRGTMGANAHRSHGIGHAAGQPASRRAA